MKTLRTFMLPAIALLLGVGSAFASNLSKNQEGKKTIMKGHYYRPSEAVVCPISLTDCITEEGDFCTDEASEELYELNGSVCDTKLYKI